MLEQEPDKRFEGRLLKWLVETPGDLGFTTLGDGLDREKLQRGSIFSTKPGREASSGDEEVVVFLKTGGGEILLHSSYDS